MEIPISRESLNFCSYGEDVFYTPLPIPVLKTGNIEKERFNYIS